MSNLFTIRACSLALMVFLVIAPACTSPESERIHLFNQIYLHLQTQEQLVPLTQGHVDGFHQALPGMNDQIPLYKVVKGPGHYLYLGKPLTSLLKTLNANSTEWETMQSTDSIFYAQWKKTPQTCALYYTEVPSKFLMLVLKDSTAAGDPVSFENLSSRISFNK